MVLMDHSEYALFRVDAELRREWPGVEIVPALGDVTRRADVVAACRTGPPDVIYHAAAYKHVSFAERAIVQALRVNALGALEAARAAAECGARFVLISSDKAAEPRSVMGATKRFAEHLVLVPPVRPRGSCVGVDLARAAGDRPGERAAWRPVIVRFGNVLASSGSVAEIMLQSAWAGRPLPVTDPDATRYFMTVSEAVALVLKTDLLAESPGIFWLDMGTPIRVGDLAGRIADFVRRSGGPGVGVDIIGMRPGEKLHEELTSQGLSLEATPHPRIAWARQRSVSRGLVRAALLRARRACAAGCHAEALAVLGDLVTDYVASGVAAATATAATKRPAPRSRVSRRPRAPLAAVSPA
jgi:FlaA1/EpsC-like NDP-sugar epimerase